MDSQPAVPADAGQVFVVRQPVFDQTRRVVGYELLLQPPAEPDAYATSLDRTSARIISDTLLAVGLDALTGGRRAFITVSRRILLEGMPDVLPASRVVLQLASDVEADADVINACRALRAAGYALAIDDFVLTPWTADLVPLASFVKVSVQSIDPETRTKLLSSQGAQGPALIAKDVESVTLFDALSSAGCKYFQGSFLGQPVVKQGRTAPGQQMTYLRLLRALNNPNLSVHDLEDLVKHDAALCFRILRTVNSAGYGLRSTVKSIRDALLLLGRDTVRRWASLWALASLNERAHSELVAMATVRARCCEVLGTSATKADLGTHAFLLGLCSLLDAILERPMSDVLADLPIDPETKGALLGTDNRMRRLLECATAYERGRWDRALELAKDLGIDPVRLPAAYAESLRWSRDLEQQRSAAA